MSKDNLQPDMAEKLQQMLQLIERQDKQIAELKSRLESDFKDEIPALRFFNLYGEFIKTINEQGLTVSRKYRTENSKNYVDAPYSIYREFVSGHLEKEEHDQFKEFLCDFQLMEPGTFNGSGLYANTNATGRTRVVRIRSDVCKWICRVAET